MVVGDDRRIHSSSHTYVSVCWFGVWWCFTIVYLCLVEVPESVCAEAPRLVAEQRHLVVVIGWLGAAVAAAQPTHSPLYVVACTFQRALKNVVRVYRLARERVVSRASRARSLRTSSCPIAT